MLNVFEAAAVGEEKPIKRFCDWFDSETNRGDDMRHYNKLLKAVIAHIRQSHAKGQARNMGRGGERGYVLSKTSETPRASNDFELVTWLVIAPAQT